MIRMRNEDRLRVLASLPALLDTELPKSVPQRFAPLSFPRLRELASRGLDIGAHTVNHPILSKLETEGGLRQEIAGSKARIEQATGVTANHFCYPNGTFSDVNDAAVTIAESAGFHTAVLAEQGFADSPFPLFGLNVSASIRTISPSISSGSSRVIASRWYDFLPEGIL